MDTSLTSFAVSGHLAYGFVDANLLRDTVDNLLPYFAKDPLADTVSGAAHRWKEGHDLGIDIYSTIINNGPEEAFKRVGHILLTDFPTKAGIPVPFLSENGLGQFLHNVCGIKTAWLNINISEFGIGFIALSESHTDLVVALTSNMQMNGSVFLDTFIEGGVQIAYSMSTKNPLIFLAGCENIFAGVVSAWETYSSLVDVIQFFSSGVVSFCAGFGLSIITGKSIQKSFLNGIKSGAVGSLFAVAPAMGIGLVAGVIIYNAGEYLAKKQNERLSRTLTVQPGTFEYYLHIFSEYDPYFKNILELSQKNCLETDFEEFKQEPAAFIKESIVKKFDTKSNLYSYNLKNLT